MILRTLIKVPLVLVENLVFATFPRLRPFIERFVFNPLDFQSAHTDYSRRKYSELRQLLDPINTLQGKTVLELGPGGSVGLGLLALEAGAKEYLAIDDGIHTFIEEKRLREYRKLLEDNPDAFDRYFVRIGQRWSYRAPIVRLLAIDQASQYPIPDKSVDLIYSCAVLEHVHNLDLCFKEMARVLKPGGLMYHEVDLRDHVFSQQSLRFLSMSDYWFSLLFRHTGSFVNRKRLSDYTRLADEHGFETITLDVLKTLPLSAADQDLQRRLSSEDITSVVFRSLYRKRD